MGQFEILKHIEKKPHTWFTAGRLSEELDTHISNVQRCMSKIVDSKFAFYRKKLENGANKKLYIKHKPEDL